MGKKTDGCQNVALDIIDSCRGAIDRNTAVKGVRNLCRYFGGGMYYIPVKKKTGRTIKEMRKAIAKAVGEPSADIIMGKIMALYGTFQIYIPLEITAFEDIIAEEIYRRNMDEDATVLEIFHDYGISFTKAYRLWRKGRSIKLRKETKNARYN